MKRIILVVAVLSLFLVSCDNNMKRCTYNVYQHGKLLPQKHVKYIRLSEWCEGYSSDGVLYVLDKVDVVNVSKIMK